MIKKWLILMFNLYYKYWHSGVFLLSGLFCNQKEKECERSWTKENNEVWILLEIAAAAGKVEVAGKLIIEFHKLEFHKVYLISNTTVLTFLIKWTYWGRNWEHRLKQHNVVIIFLDFFFHSTNLCFKTEA